MQGNAEKAGTPISSLDGLIAATASTHNLILVTRNERDFLPSRVPIINPWNNTLEANEKKDDRLKYST